MPGPTQMEKQLSPTVGESRVGLEANPARRSSAAKQGYGGCSRLVVLVANPARWDSAAAARSRPCVRRGRKQEPKQKKNPKEQEQMRTFEDFRRDGDSATRRDVPPAQWTRRPGEMAIWRGNKSRSKLRAPLGEIAESRRRRRVGLGSGSGEPFVRIIYG